MLIDRRWHSSILYVQSFRGTDCDWPLSGVWEVRKGLAVSKQEAQKFDVEKFNFGKLSEQEVRKQYQIKMSDWFPALET